VRLDAKVEVLILMLSAVKKRIRAFFHHTEVGYGTSPFEF
jgi:hypothetical protein